MTNQTLEEAEFSILINGTDRHTAEVFTDFTGTPGSFGACKECQVWRFKHCSYRGFSTCSGISGQTRTSGTSIHHHTLKKEATGDCVQWLF